MSSQSSSSMTPDLLCIGFLCHDRHQGRHWLGGTASYISMMTSQLGLHTAILTSVGPEFEFHDRFRSDTIDLHNILAAQTTVFENRYQEEERIQYLHQRAQTLYPHLLPPAWQQIPIVQFCPIADEIDASFLQYFPNALVSATIQGWLRQWDAQGKVTAKAMNWEILRHVDIVILSEEDIRGFEYILPRLRSLVDLLIITQGSKGATVFEQGRSQHFPAFPTTALDPTGAGDIFAAAFLFKYQATQQIAQAMAFAHSAASLVIEHYGAKIPELSRIEERYEQYLKG